MYIDIYSFGRINSKVMNAVGKAAAIERRDSSATTLPPRVRGEIFDSWVRTIHVDTMLIMALDVFFLAVLLVWQRMFLHLFYFIFSLIADGPHHYHPACGH